MVARAMAVDPNNPKQLVAAIAIQHGSQQTALGGVFKSTDGGVTWAKTIAAPSADVVTLPNDFTHQYAGVGVANVQVPTASVYRSVDGGSTWTSLSGPWAANQSQIGETIVAFAPSDINRLQWSKYPPMLNSPMSWVGGGPGFEVRI